MHRKYLYIFVEGDNDKDFISSIFKNKFEYKYNKIVRIIKYAKLKKKDINNLITTIRDNNGTYLILCDFDTGPCYTQKKQDLLQIYGCEHNTIYIAQKCIESWYCAGLKNEFYKKYFPDIPYTKYSCTDNLGKGFLKNLKFSHLDFMKESLKSFCIETAKRRNTSFNYFYSKHIE